VVVVREKGWCIEVYTDDHLPPHVHAWYGDGEVKVSIPPPDEPVSVLRVINLSTQQAVRRAHGRKPPRLAAVCLEQDP
jgi:hypothetical protein